MRFRDCKTCFNVFVHVVEVGVQSIALQFAAKKFFSPFQNILSVKKKHVRVAAAVYSKNFTLHVDAEKNFLWTYDSLKCIIRSQIWNIAQLIAL